MTRNRELIRKYIKDQVELTGLPITQTELDNHFNGENAKSISRKTISKQVKRLRQDDKIVQKDIGTIHYAPFEYDIDKLVDNYSELAGEIRKKFHEIDQLTAFDKTNIPERFVAEMLGRDPENETFRAVFRNVASEFEWSKPSDEEIERNLERTKGMVVESLRHYNHWHQSNSIQPVKNENLEIAWNTIQDYHDRNQELLHDFDVIEYQKDGYGIKRGAKVEAPDRLKRYLPEPVLNVDIEVPEKHKKFFRERYREKYGLDIEKVDENNENE